MERVKAAVVACSFLFLLSAGLEKASGSFIPVLSQFEKVAQLSRGHERTDTDDAERFFQKASAYDERDTRETFEDYAKSHHLELADLKSKFSATGHIQCGLGSATANITLSSNVIVTANHVFCESHVAPTACTFTYTYADDTQTIPIAALAASGQGCNVKYDAQKDWAVLRLASPAKGPVPYRIDPDLLRTLFVGTEVVLVTDHSIDFCAKGADGKCLRNPNTKEFILPRHIGDCELRYIAAKGGVPRQYLTNCASGAGASGGALLHDKQHPPILIGLHLSGPESKQEEDRERRTGMPVIHPSSFNDKSKKGWFAYELPVNGVFADAIRKAAGEQNPPRINLIKPLNSY